MTFDIKHYSSRGCGALILNDEGEVLLLLRSSDSRNDINQWSQPGGAVEENLSIEENIKKEIMEEIGVEIDLLEYLTSTSHRDDQNEWIAYSFLARIKKGVPTICEPEKHQDLNWFPLSDLPDNINQVTTESIDAYLSTRSKRGKRALIAFDMDGTLIPNTSANIEIAKALGMEDSIHELEELFRQSKINSAQYASSVLDIYRRVDSSIAKEAFLATKKLDNLELITQWAIKNGLITVVVTTGPDFYADYFKTLYQFDHVFSAKFPLSEDLDYSSCKILESEDKPIHIEKARLEYSLDKNKVICIGDSRSDIPLFNVFSNTIALNSCETLRPHSSLHINSYCALDLVPYIKSFLS